jgi:hypothetical protein
MALIYFAHEVVGIDSYAMHARAANEEAGPTTIFFPLAESVDRLGYIRSGWKNIVPVQKIQDLLKNHQDYYATVFKLNIENASENCPVPAGTKWFNFSVGEAPKVEHIYGDRYGIRTTDIPGVSGTSGLDHKKV